MAACFTLLAFLILTTTGCSGRGTAHVRDIDVSGPEQLERLARQKRVEVRDGAEPKRGRRIPLKPAGAEDTADTILSEIGSLDKTGGDHPLSGMFGKPDPKPKPEKPKANVNETARSSGDLPAESERGGDGPPIVEPPDSERDPEKAGNKTLEGLLKEIGTLENLKTTIPPEPLEPDGKPSDPTEGLGEDKAEGIEELLKEVGTLENRETTIPSEPIGPDGEPSDPEGSGEDKAEGIKDLIKEVGSLESHEPTAPAEPRGPDDEVDKEEGIKELIKEIGSLENTSAANDTDGGRIAEPLTGTSAVVKARVSGPLNPTRENLMEIKEYLNNVLKNHHRDLITVIEVTSYAARHKRQDNSSIPSHPSGSLRMGESKAYITLRFRMKGGHDMDYLKNVLNEIGDQNIKINGKDITIFLSTAAIVSSERLGNESAGIALPLTSNKPSEHELPKFPDLESADLPLKGRNRSKVSDKPGSKATIGPPMDNTTSKSSTHSVSLNGTGPEKPGHTTRRSIAPIVKSTSGPSLLSNYTTESTVNDTESSAKTTKTEAIVATKPPAESKDTTITTSPTKSSQATTSTSTIAKGSTIKSTHGPTIKPTYGPEPAPPKGMSFVYIVFRDPLSDDQLTKVHDKLKENGVDTRYIGAVVQRPGEEPKSRRRRMKRETDVRDKIARVTVKAERGSEHYKLVLNKMKEIMNKIDVKGNKAIEIRENLEFAEDKKNENEGISVWLIILIIVAALLVIIVTIVIAVMCMRKKGKRKALTSKEKKSKREAAPRVKEDPRRKSASPRVKQPPIKKSAVKSTMTDGTQMQTGYSEVVSATALMTGKSAEISPAAADGSVPLHTAKATDGPSKLEASGMEATQQLSTASTKDATGPRRPSGDVKDSRRESKGTHTLGTSSKGTTISKATTSSKGPDSPRGKSSTTVDKAVSGVTKTPEPAPSKISANVQASLPSVFPEGTTPRSDSKSSSGDTQ